MRMRPSLVLSALALTAISAGAQSNLRPAPSGRGITEVTLNPPQGSAQPSASPITIRIDYGQPHLRGRRLHTDSLVPYNTPWRTGANAPTKLTTGADITLGTANLAKGTYVLYTLPSASGWKLIIQRDNPETAYDAQFDMTRIDLRHRTLASPIESLTFWLIPSTAPGAGRGELRLAWGTFEVSTDWSVR